MSSVRKDTLKKRLDENYTAFIESLQEKTASELIAMAPEITAAQQLHEELLDALLDHKGPVLISGYDCPLYQDRLRGWRREEAVSYSQAASRKTEVLWLNLEPDGQQMTMTC